MIRKLFFSFIVVGSLSIDAQASRPTDAWFECSEDKECVAVQYTCAGNIVNKKFEQDAHKYYGEQNAVSNCITPKPTREMKKIPFKIFCEKNKCKQQGINPNKPSFS